MPQTWLYITNLLHIGNSTRSSLTVCMVTEAVYRTSLSKQTTLTRSTPVIQVNLDPFNRSCTISISLQQKHSTALGIKKHFAQEHHEV